MKLAEELEMGLSLFQLSSADTSAFTQGARFVVSSTQSKVLILMLFSSEGVDIFSIEAGEFEELPNKRLLPSKSHSLCQGLPFLPDLHTEVARWTGLSLPYSLVLWSQTTIMGLNEHGYGAIPRVEEMFASHLYPEDALCLKAQMLPTKPCKTTSNLLGKAYVVALYRHLPGIPG